MMKKNYFLGLCFLWVLSTFAQTEYLDGVILLNEGASGTEGATLSFFNQNNELTNDIYGLANNGQLLGGTGQSIGYHGDIAIVVLNMSNKIEIMNNKTYQHVATIDEGLINPRYVTFYDNKAYVTCWGNAVDDEDYIAVVDLTNYSIESTIPLDTGIEKIYEHEGKLIVLHEGGYNFGNKMTVYTIATGNTQEITLGDVPRELVFNDGYAYILNGGVPSWTDNETAGSLSKINLTTLETESLTTFPLGFGAKNMGIKEGNLYIAADTNVYTYDLEQNELADTPLIETGITGYSGIYGMNIVGDKIYIADAHNYLSPGYAMVYHLNGELMQTYTVGSSPRSFHKSMQTAAGIKNPSKLQISLYPNPASDKLYLTTEKATTVKIYDMLGKQVYAGSYNAGTGIDISRLANGTYLLQAVQNEGSQTIRFVKK